MNTCYYHVRYHLPATYHKMSKCLVTYQHFKICCLAMGDYCYLALVCQYIESSLGVRYLHKRI